MTADEALGDIRGYAEAHRITLSPHAAKRCQQRKVQYHDLRHALINANECNAEPSDRWCVHGPDLDGDPIRIVVVIENGLIVVTVMGD